MCTRTLLSPPELPLSTGLNCSRALRSGEMCFDDPSFTVFLWALIHLICRARLCRCKFWSLFRNHCCCRFGRIVMNILVLRAETASSTTVVLMMAVPIMVIPIITTRSIGANPARKDNAVYMFSSLHSWSKPWRWYRESPDHAIANKDVSGPWWIETRVACKAFSVVLSRSKWNWCEGLSQSVPCKCMIVGATCLNTFVRRGTLRLGLCYREDSCWCALRTALWLWYPAYEVELPFNNR